MVFLPVQLDRAGLLRSPGAGIPLLPLPARALCACLGSQWWALPDAGNGPLPCPLRLPRSYACTDRRHRGRHPRDAHTQPAAKATKRADRSRGDVCGVADLRRRLVLQLLAGSDRRQHLGPARLLQLERRLPPCGGPGPRRRRASAHGDDADRRRRRAHLLPDAHHRAARPAKSLPHAPRLGLHRPRDRQPANSQFDVHLAAGAVRRLLLPRPGC